MCAFLVKRGHLDTNPVARLDRPPHRREAPRQVPGSAIMDALVKAAQQRQRPRDLAIFLILRYSGMRRESVATLRVRNLDRRWGLRNVPEKGGKTRDIPLPAAVMQVLDRYVTQYLPTEVDDTKPDMPLFWSTFGQRRQGLVRRPMEGMNVWRLCKSYGRLIGYPLLKPQTSVTAWRWRSTSSMAISSRCAVCSVTRGSRRRSSTPRSARSRSSRRWSSTRRRRSTS